MVKRLRSKSAIIVGCLVLATSTHGFHVTTTTSSSQGVVARQQQQQQQQWKLRDRDSGALAMVESSNTDEERSSRSKQVQGMASFLAQKLLQTAIMEAAKGEEPGSNSKISMADIERLVSVLQDPIMDETTIAREKLSTAWETAGQAVEDFDLLSDDVDNDDTMGPTTTTATTTATTTPAETKDEVLPSLTSSSLDDETNAADDTTPVVVGGVVTDEVQDYDEEISLVEDVSAVVAETAAIMPQDPVVEEKEEEVETQEATLDEVEGIIPSKSDDSAPAMDDSSAGTVVSNDNDLVETVESKELDVEEDAKPFAAGTAVSISTATGNEAMEEETEQDKSDEKIDSVVKEADTEVMPPTDDITEIISTAKASVETQPDDVTSSAALPVRIPDAISTEYGKPLEVIVNNVLPIKPKYGRASASSVQEKVESPETSPTDPSPPSTTTLMSTAIPVREREMVDMAVDGELEGPEAGEPLTSKTDDVEKPVLFSEMTLELMSEEPIDAPPTTSEETDNELENVDDLVTSPPSDASTSLRTIVKTKVLNLFKRKGSTVETSPLETSIDEPTTSTMTTTFIATKEKISAAARRLVQKRAAVDRTVLVARARQQPKSEQEERLLAEKYGSMGLEERAFTILYDLGMIEINPNLNDPNEEDSFDEEQSQGQGSL
jgi:hypothetical protein